MNVKEHISEIVAIQGIEGSFHEIAAHAHFGDQATLVSFDSFPALFQSLQTQACPSGIIAIENSVAGSLLPNYALLRESSKTISGEIYLRISHNLMALPGQQMADITEVYSHPMALKQCRRFFKAYPHIKLVESDDTAGSAKWVQETGTRGVAAIASTRAAEIYGLEILADAIEDNPRNFTRFLILDNPEADSKISPNKASLSFNLAHAVGSLAQLLTLLSVHEMNLSKIQSMPLLGKEWEYIFHIDVEFEDYTKYKQALVAIGPMVEQLQVLGEYTKGELVS